MQRGSEIIPWTFIYTGCNMFLPFVDLMAVQSYFNLDKSFNELFIICSLIIEG